MKQMKLPDLQVAFDPRIDGGNYRLNRVGLDPIDMGPPLTTETLQGRYHEIRHHEQGGLDLSLMANILRRRLGSDFRGQTEEARSIMNRSDYIRETVLPELKEQGSGLTMIQKLASPTEPLSAIVWNKKFGAKFEELVIKESDNPSGMSLGRDIPEAIASMAAEARNYPNSEVDAAIRRTLQGLLESRVTELRSDGLNVVLNGYIGARHEKQAWATGLLSQIRARAHGLPDNEYVNNPDYPAATEEYEVQPLVYLRQQSYSNEDWRRDASSYQ
jgi:hypothetical protein